MQFFNSEWIKTNFSTGFSCDLTEKLDVGISFRFHGSDWDAPGYIPEEQFKSKSRSRHQAVNAEDDGGEKEFSSQKLDLGYNFTKIFGDISFFDTEVRKNPGKQLEGKEISGVPENIINFGVKYVFPQGVGGRVKWRHIDESFIDEMNRFETDSYDVVDLSLFYTLHDSKGTEYKINFRVDNLFDEHYSQAVWHGYGTNNYAVSWPRTFWGGFSVNW